MEIIDNVTSLLGDDLKRTVQSKAKLRIAASCFSIYAFEALKRELERVAACYDTGITEEMVKKLAARKPLRAVFRDSGFSSDAVKINVEQILKLLSPDIEVKAI